ncbi:MAG: phenylacetate--CoA ligase [Promethearchaeota archaeon]
MTYNYWNRERELATREEIEEVQLRELKGVVRRCYENVAHYKRVMDEMGLKPDDVNSLADLLKFPLTVKTDLRDNYPFGMFAAPLSEIVRIHASSGTTGKPTVVGYTAHDIHEVWTEVMARTCVCAGVTRDDVVQNAYGYGLFTGGLGFHYGAERVGATVIPISGGNTERQIMLMQDFGSTVITCTPSYASYIAEVIKEQDVPLDRIKLRLGIFGAEPWSEKLREKIESSLNVSAIDIYGLSEVIGPGVSVECVDKQGLHVWEDHFLVEALDSDNMEPVAPGERGELVFTTLTKEGIPLIRYTTKDVSRLDVDKCSCGRWHARHSKIMGRSDDMLIVRGINVFPSQIEYVLMKHPTVGEYYEIIVDRKILDTLKVRVELTQKSFSDKMRDLETLKQELEHDLYTTLQVRAEVELVPPGTIPRSVGKAKRVIDLRKEM